ncbi:RDD family protein [Streptomyces pactum]|uniref:RDD family protein n=1 Tax=Streptomyces pactum TaxID=68249 RepID=A0ABS0NIV5_9ACTN|nr:RDD family protein [Streptomyces pactum]
MRCRTRPGRCSWTSPPPARFRRPPSPGRGRAGTPPRSRGRARAPARPPPARRPTSPGVRTAPAPNRPPPGRPTPPGRAASAASGTAASPGARAPARPCRCRTPAAGRARPPGRPPTAPRTARRRTGRGPRTAPPPRRAPARPVAPRRPAPPGRRARPAGRRGDAHPARGAARLRAGHPGTGPEHRDHPCGGRRAGRPGPRRRGGPPSPARPPPAPAAAGPAAPGPGGPAAAPSGALAASAPSGPSGTAAPVPAGPAAPGPAVPGPAAGVPAQGGPSGAPAQGWAQQVQQLARPGGDGPAVAPAPGAPAGPGAGGLPPEGVIPWKPPVDNPFLQAARAQGRPATLGRRLAARLIDSVLLAAVVGAAAVPLWTRAEDHIDAKIEEAKLTGETVTVYLLDGTTGTYLGIVLGVLLVAGLLYEALPTAKWGRTLGKKLCGLRTLDIESHDTPTFGSALRRWLVYGVLGVLVIGVVNVVWCLFDRPWRQCWHDKAAHTFVATGG